MIHAHYKHVLHKTCNGTGWLTTKGSKNQIRCKCENGYILQKQDDLVDVLFDIARTANAQHSPIKPDGWEIGKPPTPEDQ